MFRKKLKYFRDNPEQVIKYYNIFTWLILRYTSCVTETKPSLLDAYIYSQACAFKSGDAGSWWDVFDGIMWIISFVGGIITYGLLFG